MHAPTSALSCARICAAFEKLKREAEAEDAQKAALWADVRTRTPSFTSWVPHASFILRTAFFPPQFPACGRMGGLCTAFIGFSCLHLCAWQGCAPHFPLPIPA